MNKRLSLLLIFIAVVGFTAYQLSSRQPDTIVATGTIEITRADIAPRVNGYIGELLIEPGDQVTAGQVVARILRPDLEAQLLADQAALAKARALLLDLEKGPRPQELQQAAATLATATAVLHQAANDLARTNSLYTQGAVSAQQLDAANANHAVAHNALQSAEAQHKLLLAGNRPDTIKAQQLEVERLGAALAVTKTALADTTLTSPLTGVVLTKNFEPGEYAGIGSALATVGDPSDCWLKVYLPSTQLSLISLGQAAAVKVDAYPDYFQGTIKEISQQAEFTPRQSITSNERANLVFAVKIKLVNEQGILKPGMPADVVLK